MRSLHLDANLSIIVLSSSWFNVFFSVHIIINCSRCEDVNVLHNLFLINLSLENDYRHETSDIDKVNIYVYAKNNEEQAEQYKEYLNKII